MRRISFLVVVTRKWPVFVVLKPTSAGVCVGTPVFVLVQHCIDGFAKLHVVFAGHAVDFQNVELVAFVGFGVFQFGDSFKWSAECFKGAGHAFFVVAVRV